VGQTRPVKLRYTLPALADLNEVLDHIEAHSPRGAPRVQARIQGIIDLLLLHPHIGTRTNDLAIRRMTTSPYPYLIFDESTAAEIIIHAVRHAARDPAGMPGASWTATEATRHCPVQSHRLGGWIPRRVSSCRTADIRGTRWRR